MTGHCPIKSTERRHCSETVECLLMFTINKRARQIAALRSVFKPGLREHLGNAPGANRPATFANCKALASFHGHGGDDLNFDGNIVARHNHFNPCWKGDGAGDVRSAEIELRTIIREEW